MNRQFVLSSEAPELVETIRLSLVKDKFGYFNIEAQLPSGLKFKLVSVRAVHIGDPKLEVVRWSTPGKQEFADFVALDADGRITDAFPTDSRKTAPQGVTAFSAENNGKPRC